MTIGIYERNGSGHRLVYVRELAARASILGWQVELLLPSRVLASDEYSTHLGELVSESPRVCVRPFDGDPSRDRIRTYSRFIVPDFDAFPRRLWPRLASRSADVRLLVMNDPMWIVGKGLRPTLRRVAKTTLLHFVDRLPGVRVFRLRPPRLSKSYTSNEVMDPLLLERSDATTASQEDGPLAHLADNVFWIGIVGGINSRKNYRTVAEAIAAAAPAVDFQLGLALIGPLAPDARGALVSLRDSLNQQGCAFSVCNRVLSNREMNDAIAALDCVALAYSSNAPNSTTAKAAAMGKRILPAGSDVFLRFVSETTGARGYSLTVDSLRDGIIAVSSSPSPSPLRYPGPEYFTDPLVHPQC